VVFAPNTPAEVRAAMQPLIEHRQRRVPPDRCKVLEHRTGKEGVREWLQRYGANPGQITATRVPYYVLLVGSPTVIPFEFQYLLDIEYAVGRLDFERPEQFRQYAESVVAYETARDVPNSREIVYWATRHNSLDATQMSADWLATPLFEGLPADENNAAQQAVARLMNYRSRLRKGNEATKAQLREILRDSRPPALLFTASHGVSWPLGSPEQVSGQGALVYQDWPGAGPIRSDHCLADADIDDPTRLYGMVAFFHACYSAGTPEFDPLLR
jgi:hypothetical protein